MFISQNLIGPTSIAIRAIAGLAGRSITVSACTLFADECQTQVPDNCTKHIKYPAASAPREGVHRRRFLRLLLVQQAWWLLF
jgi:hypothetical protein